MKRAILLTVAILMAWTGTALACSALLTAFSQSSPDPNIDKFLWKMGYVVSIYPDGHIWADSEGLPSFWRVNITGMSVEDCQFYAEGLYDWSNPDEPVERGLRGRKLNPNFIPANIRNKLERDGEITVNAQQVINYFETITE